MTTSFGVREEDEELLFRGLPGAEKLRKEGKRLARERDRKRFWKDHKPMKKDNADGEQE